MQIAQFMTSHRIMRYEKLQEQETLLNEIHGNVSYNIP